MRKARLVSRGARSRIYRTAILDNFSGSPGNITIGSNTHIRGQLLVFPNGGKIQLGDYCYVGEHARIWSMQSIRIGNHVLISHGVNIHDNNSHSLSAKHRREHIRAIFEGGGHPRELSDVRAADIQIKDNVWIGFQATILKGVTIGTGAVVGACSLVTKSVPDYAIVAGNPASIIGEAQP